MEEHQLKELAYTIFFGACGKRSNAEHVQVMRAQLEVSSCAKSPNKHMCKRLDEAPVAMYHFSTSAGHCLLCFPFQLASVSHNNMLNFLAKLFAL